MKINKSIILGIVLLMFSSFVHGAYTDDAVAFYPMTSDCTENTFGADGTNHGATFVDANNGCDFENSESDYVDISNIVSGSNFDNGGYMCAWFTVESVITNIYVMSLEDSSAVDEKMIDIQQSGNYIKSFSYSRAGGLINEVFGTSSIVGGDSNFRHYCVNYNSNGHILNFWENAVDKGSDTTPDIPKSFDSANIGAYIWADGSSRAGFWDGKIMGVLLGSGTLTQTDVNTMYAGGRTYNPFLSESFFELTAIEPYNSGAITDFTAYIDNSTTTDTISTTNGTILWDQNELINYTAYSSVYFPFTVYNTNTSSNSEITLYKHKLIYPENNYELSNAENITFQYNLTSDYNTFTNCKLYINDSLISTDTSLGLGINEFYYEFTDNGEYEWWVSCNDTESRSRFITVTNVTGPSIISQTPTNTSLTYSEGDTVSFSVSVSSYINYIVKWFKDTVQQATGSVWNWITNGNDAGDYNITAVVEDSFGQTDSTEWDLTITNVNLAPVVSTIFVSEDTIFQNIDYTVSCEITDSDTNSDDLLVDLQWYDTTWHDVTEYYDGSDTWKFNITAGTHTTGDVLSYRCRGTDNNTPALTSDWYTLPNYRTVGVEQTAPETPELLQPKYGTRKYTIPVLCAGAYDGQEDSQRIYYELYVRKDLGAWELIRNQSGVMLYSYNIADDDYDTMYDFKCRAWDGIEYSGFIENINATVKKNVPVFSILNVMDTPVYIKGKQYQQGFFIDVSALGSDYSIYQVTAECNDDGILDYSESGLYRAVHKGVYTCINQAGTFKHTVNAYIYKNNTDEKWTQVCTDLEPTQQYCNIQKAYEVTVNE